MFLFCCYYIVTINNVNYLVITKSVMFNAERIFKLSFG